MERKQIISPQGHTRWIRIPADQPAPAGWRFVGEEAAPVEPQGALTTENTGAVVAGPPAEEAPKKRGRPRGKTVGK